MMHHRLPTLTSLTLYQLQTIRGKVACFFALLLFGSLSAQAATIVLQTSDMLREQNGSLRASRLTAPTWYVFHMGTGIEQGPMQSAKPLLLENMRPGVYEVSAEGYAGSFFNGLIQVENFHANEVQCFTLPRVSRAGDADNTFIRYGQCLWAAEEVIHEYGQRQRQPERRYILSWQRDDSKAEKDNNPFWTDAQPQDNNPFWSDKEPEDNNPFWSDNSRHTYALPDSAYDWCEYEPYCSYWFDSQAYRYPSGWAFVHEPDFLRVRDSDGSQRTDKSWVVFEAIRQRDGQRVVLNPDGGFAARDCYNMPLGYLCPVDSDNLSHEELNILGGDTN